MALTPLEAMNKVVENSVVDLRSNRVTTLANMQAANRFRTIKKTNIDWDVVVEGGGTAWVGIEAEDLTNNGEDNTVPANLRIGQYRLKHTFTISRTAIQEALTLAPTDLKNLFQEKLDTGILQLAKQMNDVIWNGDGTAAKGGVIGLNKVMDNTASYAGISTATMPKWVCPTLTNATPRALTRDLLLDFDYMEDLEEVNYNYISVNPSVAKTYTKVFDQLAGAGAIAYTPKSTGSTSVQNVELGHGDIYYKGSPIVKENKQQPGQMVFMDMSQIWLYTFDMATDPDVTSGISKTGDAEFGRIVSSMVNGMQVNMSELPSNVPTVKKFELFVVPQLRVRNRRAIQVIDKLL